MTQCIQKFAILGERCSGTNFLEESISANFNINYTAEYGGKHFFCYNDYTNKDNTNNTLFIGIIRNPVYWLNSFSKELHHVPEINRKSLHNFLFNEFYSVEDEINPRRQQIFESNFFIKNDKLYTHKYNINKKDLNYLNGQKYKNIFELRSVKNKFLINEMPSKVNNYILINYEDLLFNFENIMKIIKEKFNLSQKTSSFKKEKKYKKSETYNFVKQREITFTPEIIKLIWNNLNVNQENLLGYFPFDNNHFFTSKYTSQ
jgi:hypothetical protein